MPNLNIPFRGASLIVPGAYYADDPNGVLSNSAVSTPPLIFLGQGYGQKPQTPVNFSTPQALLNALRGGPCSGFVPFLTSPSAQLAGAQNITYINVGAATQSSYCASSATSGVINFTSTDYGLPSNQLQVKIASGSVAGKAVTLYDGYSGLTSPTGDNLGVPLRVAYTGAATGSLTYTVTVVGSAATSFALASPTAGESVTVNLQTAPYNTVAGLSAFINGTGHWAAYALSNGGLATSSLDAAAAVAMTAVSGSTPQYSNIFATLADIVYFVNTYASGFATAAITSGVTSSSGVAPTNIPFTFFTGATSTAPTTSDYASGFNVALTVPGSVVFADSNASGVVALGTSHAFSASQPAVGKWRRFFSGSSIGDTTANAITAAQSQNSISTTYVYPGIYRTNPVTGINTLYSGLYSAAAAAGMAVGNQPALPLTNKAVSANGVETQLTVSQVDSLQQGGVMPIWVSPQTGAVTIISDFTTWQNDANPENVFNQQVSCRFTLAYAMIAAATPYVGGIAAPLTQNRLLDAIKACLNSQIYAQNNVDGVLSSWTAGSLLLTYNGSTQAASISVNVTFVGQNRFITMYVPIQPLSLTASSVTSNQGQIG